MKESLVSVAFQLHLFSHFEAVSRSVHVQHNPFSFPSKVESHFRSVLIKKKKHLRGLSVRSVCTGTGVHTNLHHGLYRVCLHFYQSERHEMSFSFQRVNPEKLHTGKCTFLHTTDTLQI